MATKKTTKAKPAAAAKKPENKIEKKAEKKPAVAKAPVAEKKPKKEPEVRAPETEAAAGYTKPIDYNAEVGIDSAKALAFVMSIARERKASAKKEEEKVYDNGIRLPRRPTTRTQGKNTNKFSAADLKDFRKRLMAARAEALKGIDAMKATGFNESEDHEADGGDGTNQTLRLQALGQMGNINRTIQKIDEALHRIDDGTYGVCTVCGQLIRKPRLLNQPFVLTCMECQSEMERAAQTMAQPTTEDDE